MTTGERESRGSHRAEGARPCRRRLARLASAWLVASLFAPHGLGLAATPRIELEFSAPRTLLTLQAPVDTCAAARPFLTSADEGPVTKSLTLQSDPPGADVFLKQGTKETKIGTTPLTYQAEFHSPISILRFTFKKRLYKDVVLEVSAQQEGASATLEPMAVTRDPAKETDPELRALQEALDPILQESLPLLLEAEGPFRLDLAAPARVTRTEQDTRLIVPLKLERSASKPEGSPRERYQTLARALWQQIGGSLAIPLAKKLEGRKGLGEMLIAVHFDERRYLFNVESRVETRVEMQCVPGYRQERQYVPCAYYVSGVCKPGMAWVPVFEPCKERVPVTKTEVKIDPKVGRAAGQAQIGFVLPLSVIGTSPSPAELADKVRLEIVDAKGKNPLEGGAPGLPPAP